MDEERVTKNHEERHVFARLLLSTAAILYAQYSVNHNISGM